MVLFVISNPSRGVGRDKVPYLSIDEEDFSDVHGSDEKDSYLVLVSYELVVKKVLQELV